MTSERLCERQPSERSPRTAWQKGGGVASSQAVGTGGAATARPAANAAVAITAQRSNVRRIILMAAVLPWVRWYHLMGSCKRRAAMQNHRVVSRDEWLAARKALLAREKEETHLR